MDKILIVNLGGIGDLVLSAPALVSLRARYPRAQIDLLTAKKNIGIVGRWSVVDNEYGIDFSFGGRVTFSAFFRAVGLLWRLRCVKYDALVNMRTLYSASGAKKIRTLCRFVAAKKTFGRNTEGLGAFFDESIFETRVGLMHESSYDAETVALLGARTTELFSFPVPPQAERAAAAFCGEHGLQDGHFLLWHVGGMPSRRYPAELVVAALKKLDPSLGVVLTAGAPERNVTAEICAQVPSVIDAAGVFGIDALAAMMKRAGAVISNDTGPMHVAAVLGVPLIALLGPGDLRRFDPRFIEPAATVLRGDVRCAPCEHEFCAKKLCLKVIEPAAVAGAVKKIFDMTDGGREAC